MQERIKTKLLNHVFSIKVLNQPVIAEPSGGKAGTGSAIPNKLDTGEQYFFSFDPFTYSWVIFC